MSTTCRRPIGTTLAGIMSWLLIVVATHRTTTVAAQRMLCPFSLYTWENDLSCTGNYSSLSLIYADNQCHSDAAAAGPGIYQASCGSNVSRAVLFANSGCTSAIDECDASCTADMTSIGYLYSQAANGVPFDPYPANYRVGQTHNGTCQSVLSYGRELSYVMFGNCSDYTCGGDDNPSNIPTPSSPPTPAPTTATNNTSATTPVPAGGGNNNSTTSPTVVVSDLPSDAPSLSPTAVLIQGPPSDVSSPTLGPAAAAATTTTPRPSRARPPPPTSRPTSSDTPAPSPAPTQPGCVLEINKIDCPVVLANAGVTDLADCDCASVCAKTLSCLRFNQGGTLTCPDGEIFVAGCTVTDLDPNLAPGSSGVSHHGGGRTLRTATTSSFFVAGTAAMIAALY